MTDIRLMTSGEVAEYLQLHRQTINRMAAKGELPGIKFGREWRFRKEDISAYVEDKIMEGKEIAPALSVDE